jgi:hypothetical protein
MADQNVAEVWRLIAAHPDYEVSNMGRVRRATDVTVPMPNGGIAIRARAGQLLKNGRFQTLRTSRGWILPYLRVTLQDGDVTRTLRVHRLVAKAFIPNPDNKPVVNHINFDISDARAENLEWCSHKENCAHASLNGRQATPNPKFGVDQRSAKLDDDAVRQIRRMSASGMSNAKVAKVFGINRSCVSRIRCGLQWKHVT